MAYVAPYIRALNELTSNGKFYNTAALKRTILDIGDIGTSPETAIEFAIATGHLQKYDDDLYGKPGLYYDRAESSVPAQSTRRNSLPTTEEYKRLFLGLVSDRLTHNFMQFGRIVQADGHFPAKATSVLKSMMGEGTIVRVPNVTGQYCLPGCEHAETASDDGGGKVGRPATLKVCPWCQGVGKVHVDQPNPPGVEDFVGTVTWSTPVPEGDDDDWADERDGFSGYQEPPKPRIEPLISFDFGDDAPPLEEKPDPYAHIDMDEDD